MTSYYDNDFDWEEHAREGRAVVAAIPRLSEEEARAILSSDQEAAWDGFFRRNSSGLAYKDRRYLPLAFPQLLEDGHVLLEYGCGYGCSILPVVERNPTIQCIGVDVSQEALRIFATRPVYLQHQSRIRLLHRDAAAQGPPPSPDDAAPASLVLMAFFLSAVPPQHHVACLDAAWQSLKPGGWLLFRDHGLFDKCMLRSSKRLHGDGDVHVRADGTLATYFSLEAFVALLVPSDRWVVQECRYATVRQVNRKSGQVIKRVFVHARVQKRAIPEEEESAAVGEGGARYHSGSQGKSICVYGEQESGRET